MSVYTTTGMYGNTTVIGGGGAGTSTQTVSISGAGINPSSVLMSNGTGTTWATNAKTTAQGKLHLEGENADIVLNGISLKDLLHGITDRLAVLQPKPDLLEKYENLREAYEHYKTLEALLHEAEDAK